MKKEQKVYLVVAVLGLLLAIGGVLYFKNYKKIDNVDVSSTKDQNQESNSEIDDSNNIVTDKAGTEEFNKYITDARTAFINKDYAKSLADYNKALGIFKADTVYAGMYTVYTAQGDWTNALSVLDKAIALKPSFTDYWIWKIGLLDEKTSTSFTDLKKVYNDALTKVDAKTKINIVTYFAGVAEDNNEIDESISLWQYAKILFPDNSLVFQAEIDRLNKLQ